MVKEKRTTKPPRLLRFTKKRYIAPCPSMSVAVVKNLSAPGVLSVLVVKEKGTTKALRALRFTEKICNFLWFFMFSMAPWLKT